MQEQFSRVLKHLRASFNKLKFKMDGRKSRVVKSLFFGAIYASALAFFAFQVKDVCIKYVKHKTTISTSQMTMDEIAIPIVTICSGYKPSLRVKNMHILLARDIEKPSLFKRSTYKLRKDFYIVIGLDSDFFELNEGQNVLSFDSGSTIEAEVMEFTTMSSSGLCYAIKIKHSLRTTNDYISLYMYHSQNVTGPDAESEFTAVISNQTRKFAAFYNDWQGFKGIRVGLKKRSKTVVDLYQSILIQLEEKGVCQAYDEGSRPQCQMEKLFHAARSEILEKCSRPCIVPALESGLVQNDTFKPKWDYCQTYEESTCVFENSFAVYDREVQACKQSCFDVDIHGEIVLAPFKDDAAHLVIYFESMTVKVHEELLLFDLSSFIGNIGGSLGLFIGFSYLDFATKITNTFIRLLSMRK